MVPRFLSRHEDVLTRNGSEVKDLKRGTWVKSKIFQNMYENIYATMVEVGIAEELEEEIQHERGLPTKKALTEPEFLLFIDETGCNMNQLSDGKVGGELFIMPKNIGDGAAPAGATTDSTLLSCPLSLAQVNLCFVLLSSKVNNR
jgi:hypothetical protein